MGLADWLHILIIRPTSSTLFLKPFDRSRIFQLHKMISQHSKTVEEDSSPKSEAALGRHQSFLSKIRGRHPDLATPHTHRLEHLKTDSEHIVQFDGPADPYKPLNWGFGKKTCTTILYGFITMGKSPHPSSCLNATRLLTISSCLGSAWASSAYVSEYHHLYMPLLN